MQYFTGERPSSYAQISDPSLVNGKDEIEYRQCAHCAYQWIYKPGSGEKRGFCMQCNGLVCGKAECTFECKPFEKLLEEIEGRRPRL